MIFVYVLPVSFIETFSNLHLFKYVLLTLYADAAKVGYKLLFFIGQYDV